MITKIQTSASAMRMEKIGKLNYIESSDVWLSHQSKLVSLSSNPEKIDYGLDISFFPIEDKDCWTRYNLYTLTSDTSKMIIEYVIMNREHNHINIWATSRNDAEILRTALMLISTEV